MFTAEKSKLFFNDPKFQAIGQWSEDAQEAAVGKIFAGQRQVRRSKVAYHNLQSQESTPPSPYLLLDCLQTRMSAFEQRLVRNVQDTFLQKQRIKQKYNQAEDLYEKAQRKLRKLMTGVRLQRLQLEGIEEVEAEVHEIQRLYEENQFLRSMNEEIKYRIDKKQIQIASSRK